MAAGSYRTEKPASRARSAKSTSSENKNHDSSQRPTALRHCAEMSMAAPHAQSTSVAVS